MNEFWIARDKDEMLCLYKCKPVKYDTAWYPSEDENEIKNGFDLDKYIILQEHNILTWIGKLLKNFIPNIETLCEWEDKEPFKLDFNNLNNNQSEQHNSINENEDIKIFSSYYFN